MTLVHHCIASFNFKAANNWITSSHKNIFICYLHAFDGLFGGDETFNNFIWFKIHTSHHLVPGRREKHIINAADSGAWDWISELEDGCALPSFVVPLADRAVVRRTYYIICLRSYNGIYSVGMSNQRRGQLTTFLIKTADKAVFVPEVDLLLTETKAADESVVSLALKCAWGVEDMIWRVIDSVRRNLFVLKQIRFGWTCNWYSLSQLR